MDRPDTAPKLQANQEGVWDRTFTLWTQTILQQAGRQISDMLLLLSTKYGADQAIREVQILRRVGKNVRQLGTHHLRRRGKFQLLDAI